MSPGAYDVQSRCCTLFHFVTRFHAHGVYDAVGTRCGGMFHTDSGRSEIYAEMSYGACVVHPRCLALSLIFYLDFVLLDVTVP